MAKEIFVFGSNLAGRHGAGSARAAVEEYGAVYGKGVGISGNSYAIPTKDENIESLPLHVIKWFVTLFLEYAAVTPNNTYNVVEIGCGLAGFTVEEIAPMFYDKTANVVLTKRFEDVISGMKPKMSKTKKVN